VTVNAYQRGRCSVHVHRAAVYMCYCHQCAPQCTCGVTVTVAPYTEQPGNGRVFSVRVLCGCGLCGPGVPQVILCSRHGGNVARLRVVSCCGRRRQWSLHLCRRLPAARPPACACLCSALQPVNSCHHPLSESASARAASMALRPGPNSGPGRAACVYTDHTKGLL
jgi:hypothetical protein